MTAAREQAEARFVLDDYPPDAPDHGQYVVIQKNKQEAFVMGYEAALESVRPLLEAARAYRDAHARHWNNRGRYGAGLDAAMDALCEAARTFEAGQEERLSR